jgi:manganese/zinc/iron transport system substrate-binding protein
MIFRLLQLLTLIVALCSCSNNNDKNNRIESMQKWREKNGKLKVLSTIAMIQDLVKQIGGENIDSITLIQGELDPHSYQLVKGDGEKLSYADIIFFSGLGLEHGASLQQHLQNNVRAVGLGNLIKDHNPELILSFHEQTDPHIWMDVSLWSKTIPYIVRTLSENDPAHAEQYKQNGEILTKKLLDLHNKLRDKMMQIPQEKRYLVTSHDAFNYFARAYLATDNELESGDWKKRFDAPEGLAPDSQLSTSDIQHILDHVAQYDIHVLFPETNVSKDSIRKILSSGTENGLKLRIATPPLYGDAMGRPGSDGDTYMKMMEHNVRAISKEL